MQLVSVPNDFPVVFCFLLVSLILTASARRSRFLRPLSAGLERDLSTPITAVLQTTAIGGIVDVFLNRREHHVMKIVTLLLLAFALGVVPASAQTSCNPGVEVCR